MRLFGISMIAMAGLIPAAALAQTEQDKTTVAIDAACGKMAPEAEAKLTGAARTARLACFTRVAAEQFSAKLPMKVDPKTTLDRVAAQGTTLAYYYTADVIGSELPSGAMANVIQSVRANVCKAADMRSVIGFGGSYRYVWKDRKGTVLGETLVDRC